MKLPALHDFNFYNKKVLVRGDFDVPLQGKEIVDDARIRECLPTVKYLLDNGAKKIILMGHLGRPEGGVVEKLRLLPVAEKLKELLKSNIKYQKSKVQIKNQKFIAYQVSENIALLENLRFDKREEKNDAEFAKELAGLGDFYVNEAFATCHREHASIVGVPKFLPHCAGLHFASEVENLSKVLENPKRPLVFVIGGAKPETKLPLVADFACVADMVLVGGTLPRDQRLKIKDQKQNLKIENIVNAELTGDGLDIGRDSIEKFVEIIKKAGTVVWNGPMGKYEDEKHEAGTKKIAEAVAESKGFKVVGGGDTIVVLKKFNLLDKMDYVSTGGGAMLEFLAKGTLPGIAVLK